MARDRKKAKARQRRQQRTGPSAAVAQRHDEVRAAEPDVRGSEPGAPASEPESESELRAGERDVGAPDPLDHASADVELAQAAERGAPPLRDTRDGDGDGDGDEVFEDELEPVPGGGGDRGAGGDGKPPERERSPERPRAGGGRFLNFLRACIAELRRVQWPDRRQVTQATGVVLGFVIIAGAYLGLLDAIWSRVVEAIL